jgi:hypothetical protein
MARFLIATAPSTNNVSDRMRVWPIDQFDFTGSVRNRSLEAVKGGSFITEMEVCCPSSISRKFSIAS